MALLSLSGSFTLDGARVALDERRFPAHRGTARALIDSLRGEYLSCVEFEVSTGVLKSHWDKIITYNHLCRSNLSDFFLTL